MAGLKPIRRVVTGNDERGKSKVVWDGPAPNAHAASMGVARGHTDLWVWNETPAPLSGDERRRQRQLRLSRSGRRRAPARRRRVRPSPPDYDPAKDKEAIAPHPPRLRPGATRVWDRGGNNRFSSAFHKTETIDYGIMLAGERDLILDDSKLLMKPGDIVIQVGAWHQWSFPEGRADGVRHVRRALRGRAAGTRAGQGQADRDRPEAAGRA